MLYHLLRYSVSVVQTSQLGLTENIKGDKKKFELWLRDRVEVYIIQVS